jgi:hypothetical protein
MEGEPMKAATLKIGEKQHSKTEPTVGDWYNHLDVVEKLKGKNLLTDRDAAAEAVAYVAQFFGVTAEDIDKGSRLVDEITAYYQIQKNILDTFDEATSVWGKPEKNAKAPVS